MSGNYQFLPWVRQGAATLISREESMAPDLSAVVKQSVYLRVNDELNTKAIQLRFYSPGDVTGIHRRLITRTDPTPWSRGFSPNYFPLIEFASPDFPWLFTPVRANAQERLRPWLCLVVVPIKEGIQITHDPKHPLAVLRIEAPALPAEELPDLSESWAWAHTQVALNEGDDIKTVLKDQPEKNLSRLLCPRRLQPDQLYYACLVPTFEIGRKAGLGVPIDEEVEPTLQPAWLSGDLAPEEIELPIYYHWEFRTGAKNDFETLVKKLQFRPLPPGVGTRDMVATNLPFQLPDLGVLTLEGALRAPQTDVYSPSPFEKTGLIMTLATSSYGEELEKEPVSEAIRKAFDENGITLSEFALIIKEEQDNLYTIPDPEGKTYYLYQEPEFIWVYDLPREFAESLRTVLNYGQQLHTDLEEDPIVAPPLYGSLQAAQKLVPEDGEAPHWFRQLNLDPRQRAVAGYGTLVVQDQQDQLVAAAWEQLGDGSANQSLIQLQASQEVNQAIYQKNFRIISGEDQDETPEDIAYLQLAGQALSSIKSTLDNSENGARTIPGKQLYGEKYHIRSRIKQTSLPDKVLTSEFRKIVRRRGNIVKRIQSVKAEEAPQLMPHLKKFLKNRGRRNPFDIDERLIVFDEHHGGHKGGGGIFAKIRERYHRYLNRMKDIPDPVPQVDTLEAEVHEIKEDFIRQLNPKRNMEQLAKYVVPKVSQIIKDNDVMVSERGAEAQSEDYQIEPIIVAPQFHRPMYEPLAEISKELLLPGLDHIPENTVTLLQSNPRFIEAYMVGLNHEMSREMLWREYPSHERASYFPQFWNKLGKQASDTIDHYIHTWNPESQLGQNFPLSTVPAEEQLVILIRGELLQRFPSATIFLAKTTDPIHDLPRSGDHRADPAFHGYVEPDITFFGFEISLKEVNASDDWYLFIQEHPTEPRFGLEVGNMEQSSSLNSWRNLSWLHLVENEEELEVINYLSLAHLPPTDFDSLVKWGKNGAHMAWITFQNPFRIGIPVKTLLNKDEA